MTIRIGQIDYANCTPIFTALKDNFDCGNYRFVRGVPSELNGMLRRGEIDVCPSSSFEYGASPDSYFLLPDISISSIGPVKSVLLFSRLPIAELDNQPIALTTESDTSINLLKIILAKQYGFTNRFERSPLPATEALQSFSALLLIGDAALRESQRSRDYFVYDLGELWFAFTGLPFVFALWMVTREAVERKAAEVRTLVTQLLAAKELAYDSYAAIAGKSAEREWMGERGLVDYWQAISYDLTPRHLEGAATFFRYAWELQLLAAEPEIRLVR
ncbi:MAG TPA: menaquinone biosynthesis protein [Geobacteraceae bacterium]|nr:menaquinone biosynthesis protein [Geobacteraceae bacterium]